MYRALAVGMLALLLAPGSAFAATKPSASTGAATKLTHQSARLVGSVNPHGAATTIYFQLGPTAQYGSNTVATPIGAGTAGKRVVTDIGALQPNTVYHFRVVAENASGAVTSGDHTFTTKKQPLGLSLAATPNPVGYQQATTLAGALTGTGNANRPVVLQSRVFPYTAPFATIGNPQLTNAAGGFAFPGLVLPVNTQYRVLLRDNTAIHSPVVNVGVAVRVSTNIHRSGSLIRFSGTLRPARDGAQVAIQKQKGATWVTIGGTITRHGSTTFSRYSKSLRIHHGGTFRVLVGIIDGNFVSNAGRSVKLHSHS